MVNQTQSELLSRRQAADLLGVTVACLERWAHEGRELPYIRVGRLARYRRADIDAYLSRRCSTSAAGHQAQVAQALAAASA